AVAGWRTYAGTTTGQGGSTNGAGGVLRTDGNEGIMYYKSKVSAVHVSDGTSNTIMVAERPPIMLGTGGGGGGMDSYDQGDVAIGLRNTDFVSGSKCPSPMLFQPGAQTAGYTEGFVGTTLIRRGDR